MYILLQYIGTFPKKLDTHTHTKSYQADFDGRRRTTTDDDGRRRTTTDDDDGRRRRTVKSALEKLRCSTANRLAELKMHEYEELSKWLL